MSRLACLSKELSSSLQKRAKVIPKWLTPYFNIPFFLRQCGSESKASFDNCNPCFVKCFESFFYYIGDTTSNLGNGGAGKLVELASQPFRSVSSSLQKLAGDLVHWISLVEDVGGWLTPDPKYARIRDRRPRLLLSSTCLGGWSGYKLSELVGRICCKYNIWGGTTRGWQRILVVRRVHVGGIVQIYVALPLFIGGSQNRSYEDGKYCNPFREVK